MGGGHSLQVKRLPQSRHWWLRQPALLVPKPRSMGGRGAAEADVPAVPLTVPEGTCLGLYLRAEPWVS